MRLCRFDRDNKIGVGLYSETRVIAVDAAATTEQIVLSGGE